MRFFLWLSVSFAVLAGAGTALAEPARETSKKTAVHLYFADWNCEFLTAEERTIRFDGETADFGRAIVESLIRGPEKDLVRTVPKKTKLNAFYVTESGIGYVDLTKAVSENHPGGIEAELITIYSIVNSVVLNIPEIKAVKILIDGGEAMTLAGHVDLRFPFRANMVLIR